MKTAIIALSALFGLVALLSWSFHDNATMIGAGIASVYFINAAKLIESKS
jgi:outer membrane protein assembly factor BamE (lipoprotein component of BamABCDE complex)